METPIRPVRYSTLSRRLMEPPGKVYLLCGEEPVFSLSLTMAAQAMTHGTSIAVVDGGNHFNVHLISRFAQERRLNADHMLQRIFVSRGFTCYQMEQAITARLPQFLHTLNSKTALIFGLLETFYDEQAPLREVRHILGRILRAFHEMKSDGISLLIACRNGRVYPPERQQLLTTLKRGMDRVFRLETHPNDHLQLFLEDPSHSFPGGSNDGTHRTNVYQYHRQRAEQLVQVPQGTLPRRAGSL